MNAKEANVIAVSDQFLKNWSRMIFTQLRRAKGGDMPLVTGAMAKGRGQRSLISNRLLYQFKTAEVIRLMER